MEQKKVKIIGLELIKQTGCVKACKLEFNQENKLITVFGEKGSGKTTLQDMLKLNTVGNKILKDKDLRGEFESVVQLLDGDMKLFSGSKNEGGKFSTVFFQIDEAGKKIKNPLIDGHKATGAKYLESLQTALTWRVDEFMSQNMTEQRNLLLSLYEDELTKLDVILDRKDPKFKESILGKIEAAESQRNYLDKKRKEVGGIADDLKEKGVDPTKPTTVPDSIDIKEFETNIIKLKTQIENVETEAEREKKDKLTKLADKMKDLNLQAINWNTEQKEIYNKKKKTVEIIETRNEIITDSQKTIIGALQGLIDNEGIEAEYAEKIIKKLHKKVIINEVPDLKKPKLIDINDNKIIDIDTDKKFVADFLKLKDKYLKVSEKEIDTEEKTTELKELITNIEAEKEKAEQVNKLVKAVDAWHAWSDEDTKVKSLRSEYNKKLASVDTGVEGLIIVADEKENIYLTYDGSYDPEYFNNRNKEQRKLSAYSGTERPMIALLVQNYLLSKKEKALRCLYIDDIPIDNKTRQFIEEMGERLDITIFMNVTGDFSADNLKDGEILIENGELLFS